MILESIVTTVDLESGVNIAPMGPSVEPGVLESGATDVSFRLRPFLSSRTYQNLASTPRAVIHVTDDALLFAKGAVDALSPEEVCGLVERVAETDWWRLKDCHRWFAIEITRIEDDGLRSDMECRVVQAGTVRPFFGFHRARHAVIEAAILATRVHLIPPDQVRDEMVRLQPLVDKTGGPVEHEAFHLLQTAIDDRIAARH